MRRKILASHVIPEQDIISKLLSPGVKTPVVKGTSNNERKTIRIYLIE